MRQVVKACLLSYAVGFGTGLMRFMPGTWGSLPGVAFAFVLQKFSLPFALLAYAILVISAFFAAEERGRIVEDWDHPTIVCDEIVGIIPMLWLIPASLHWLWVFGLFRLLDIMKPFPIGWVDRHVHGPFGCLLDDLLAGLFGLLVVAYYIS